jgi:hypothetical protein
MALRTFNSVGGFSVGDTPVTIVTTTGNVTTGNLLTDNLLYANGTPWNFDNASGSDTFIQYKTNGNLDSSGNFTYNDSTQTLSLLGNANIGAYISLIGSSGNISANNANIGTSINLYSGNGNIVANSFIGNIYGNVNANIANIGSNLNILFNLDGKVDSRDTFNYTPASNALVVGNSVTSNYFIGAFDNTSNSQPNITSLGNLTGLRIGNATTAGNVVIDTGGNVTATGTISGRDAIFSGNLSVGGTTTYINSDVLSIKDPLIFMGGLANNANLTALTTSDTGIYLHNYYGSAVENQYFGWKTQEQTFQALTDAVVDGSGVVTGTTANINAYFVGNITGTVDTANQPNIANLSGLYDVAVSNLANVAQLKVGDVNYPNIAGLDGQYLRINAISNTVYYGSLDTSKVANGTTEIELIENGNITFTVDEATNVVVFTTDGANITGNANVSVNLNVTGDVNANVANVNTLQLPNSTISSTTVTTSSTSVAILASLDVASTTGIEFLVKGQCTQSGATKYSVAVVLAVTDGAGSVDYSTYGTAYLGGSTGVLSVTCTSGTVDLKVTPSTNNLTTWTIQYRMI